MLEVIVASPPSGSVPSSPTPHLSLHNAADGLKVLRRHLLLKHLQGLAVRFRKQIRLATHDLPNLRGRQGEGRGE